MRQVQKSTKFHFAYFVKKFASTKSSAVVLNTIQNRQKLRYILKLIENDDLIYERRHAYL